MREIKVRIWDTHHNYMMNDINLHRGLTLNEALESNEDFIILQYTGLKIKDIEVYEGDIIKARKDYCYKVVFENGSFVLYHTNKYAGKENIRWGLLGRFFDVDMKDILKECKVIGNIYEHSHLLDNN